MVDAERLVQPLRSWRGARQEGAAPRAGASRGSRPAEGLPLRAVSRRDPAGSARADSMRSNPRIVEQSYRHVQHITRLTQTGLEGREVLLDGAHSRPKFEIARSREILRGVFSTWPYTGYAHAILCWCFILACSDSNKWALRSVHVTFRLAAAPASHVKVQGLRLSPIRSGV